MNAPRLRFVPTAKEVRDAQIDTVRRLSAIEDRVQRSLVRPMLQCILDKLEEGGVFVVVDEKELS